MTSQIGFTSNVSSQDHASPPNLPLSTRRPIHRDEYAVTSNCTTLFHGDCYVQGRCITPSIPHTPLGPPEAETEIVENELYVRH